MLRFYRWACRGSSRFLFTRAITLHTPTDQNKFSYKRTLATQISHQPTKSVPQTEVLLTTQNSTDVGEFISGVSANLRLLQDQWMKSFRVCLSSNSTVVVEMKANANDLWSPLVTMDAASLQRSLVDVVVEALTITPIGATLIDMRKRTEDIAMTQKLLAENFPGLRLSVDHSRGTDLQGVVTHSVTVSLQQIVHPEQLSQNEIDLKKKFFGESVGTSHFSTARRALREAFSAAGVSYPAPPEERERGSSELDSYLEIVRNATTMEVEIVLSTTHEENGVRVIVQTTDKRHLGTMDGKKDNILSIILACVEKAAEASNEIATEEARKRIVDHPVVLLLPSKGVCVKSILRRLLRHTYGLEDERVRISTEQGKDSTFTTTIDAELFWGKDTNILKVEVPYFITLATAVGVNKKAAEELACVVALQRCFPQMFDDQIAYHTEVKQILTSTKATRNNSICPHVSKGLLAQLRWAAQTQRKQVVLDVMQLVPNSENESLGIKTTRPLWATQLFLVDGEGVRELVCFALDPKKSMSEQKAVASALWKLFRQDCDEGVKYAMEHRLIDVNGDPAPCDGIVPYVPVPVSDLSAAAESDPLLPTLKLVPIQSIIIPHKPSLLSIYRRGVQAYVELLNEKSGQSRRLVEDTESDLVYGSYSAQLFLETLHDKMDKIPLGKIIRDSTTVAALFTTFRDLFEDGGTIVTEALENSEVLSICNDTLKRVKELPVFPAELPASTPLETVAQCIMTKYGLTLVLHIIEGGKHVNVKLYGRSPTENTGPFYLGKGRGGSLLKAVVSCCCRVFNTHIRHESCVFAETTGETLRGGSFQIPIVGTDSILANCTAHVLRELSENNAVSSSASINVKVDIHQLSQKICYQAYMCVVDGTCSVELERDSPTSDFMVSLLHLTEIVTREIREPLEVDNLKKKINGPDQLKVLQELLKTLYGLPLVVDTVFRDQLWHCRLSIPISDDCHYSVGHSINAKKKDAIERAAESAINSCFDFITERTQPQTKCPDSSLHVKEYCGLLYRRLGT